MGGKLLADKGFRAVFDDIGNKGEWWRRGGIADEVGAEGVAVIGEATEDIEAGAVGPNQVITKAAAIDLAEVKVLEFVGFVVGEGKDKDAGRDIQVAADAGADSVGGGAGGNCSVVTGIDVGGLDSEFVGGSFANCSAGECVASC